MISAFYMDSAFKMRYDLDLFARSFFPDVKFTKQQQELLFIWGDLLRAKHLMHENKPLGNNLEIYRQVFGVSISAGQGTGKDFVSAFLLWHFMVCFPYVRVIASATSGGQTRTVFWSECRWLAGMSRKLENGRTIIEEMFEIKDEEIRLLNPKNEKEKTHKAERKASKMTKNKDEQGETIAGIHSNYMLYIIDEASGVPEGLYKPIEGTATGKINVAILVFNPTRRNSYAVKTHTDPKERKFWVPIRWNGEECDRISPDHIQRMREKFCEIDHYENIVDKHGQHRKVAVTKNHDKSSPYRIRVLGLPPLSDDEALYPRDWLEDAAAREREMDMSDPLIGGMDVGGNASPSVIAMRRGLIFCPSLFSLRSNDATFVAQWGAKIFNDNGMYQIAVDKNGIGWGVYDMMRNLLGYHPDGTPKVVGIDAQGRSRSPRYANKRAELAFRLRTALERRARDGSGCPLVLPKDDELIDELSMVYAKPGSSPFILERKERGDDSPNKADAVLLTMFRVEEWGDEEETGIEEVKEIPNWILNPNHPYFADKTVAYNSNSGSKHAWQGRW